MGKEKSKKRRHSSSSCDSKQSSDSDTSREKRKLKKLKRKLKREQKKAKKILKKKLKLENKTLKRRSRSNSQDIVEKLEPTPADVPLELMEKSKAMAPMTREEWEKKQSVIRRVLDEETGRYRLIKGDGEVLEEIVTKEKHKEINRQATRADGAFFQSHTIQ
ncbi:ADP-ribosylation factor-like protein 6-interacting protein 4 [Eumeta japonica]|uniref:ADP-ribosylation factor-like protein 6-interacting protein 4 n=1 Tax=Eumeta variegata TaxID=151549 RepID=A0A4C1W231_EUMVA|nr:ADP-ribosylation factor-like protein 6-interacting protein 4 [Eumeta japonica]